MKTAKYALCLLSLLAGLATAYAGDEAKKPQPEKSTPPTKEKPAVQKDDSGVQTETNVTLTGSYIKRTVNRSGQITDGPSPVVVIDRQAIERSGATDLRQLLVRKGLVGR
jgi:hypothetical protein